MHKITRIDREVLLWALAAPALLAFVRLVCRVTVFVAHVLGVL